MDLEKVNSILKWPTPKSATEVRYFHGLATFYRKFIRGFSSIFGPLIETIRGDRKEFKWTVGAEKSFNTLKQKVTEQSILALPNFNNVFQVDYDASGTAMRVFMSQEVRPITYFSEKLNDTKRKYSIYDQEFYAIVQGLKNWRHYLLPKEFF